MNIIFDLGGVLLRWRPEEIIENAIQDQALRQTARKQIFEHDDWLELDRGVLPLQEAVHRAAERTGWPPTKVQEIMDLVPVSLQPVPGAIELLQRLHERGHKLFVLSNMHIASTEHLLKEHTFWPLFQGAVFSCRVHLIKPEPEVYAHLITRYGLSNTEMLFIDDTEKNLRAAKPFGIRTLLFENLKQCERQLVQWGCLPADSCQTRREP